MSSTGTATPHAGLNQRQSSDKPERGDFNSDNQKIDAQLANKANMSSGIWTPTVTNAILSGITSATWRKNGTHVQATFSGNLQKGSVANDVITPA